MSEASPFPLPVSVEAVTREWVEAALRTRSPGVRLLGCEVLDVIHGTCTKVRLQRELDAAGRAAGIPERVILKGEFEPTAVPMIGRWSPTIATNWSAMVSMRRRSRS